MRGSFIGGASTTCCGREFPLYHALPKKSIGNLHKDQYRNFPIIVQYYQLTNRPICGILLVSRGDREHLFQVGLGTVCGGREKSAETLGKSQSSKKNSKNPLTNRPSCDIIRMSRGETPSPTGAWLKETLLMFFKAI